MKKFLIPLITCVVILFFFSNDTFYMVEKNFRDRVVVESRATDLRVKILAIDDESLNKIGKWPWPRDVLANVTDKLMAAGAKAVWTDVLYTEKSSNQSEDAAWEKVAAKYPGVFMSTYFNHAVGGYPNGSPQLPAFPVPPQQIGHINRAEDQDQVVRKVLLGIRDQSGQMVPAVSVLIANSLLPANEKIAWDDQGVWRTGNLVIPTGAHNDAYFLYASSATVKKFDSMPVWQVEEGGVDLSRFKDSVVLIGPYTVGLQDAFYTPVSKALPMYGVEIHANVVQALLDNEFYQVASLPVGALIILLLTVGAYLLFERVKAKWGALIFVGFVVVYTVAVLFVFTVFRLLLPFFYPLLALIIVYVASVVSQYLRERKERSRVTGIFGRYVSKAVVQEILATKEEIKVGGIRKDVTLMFVDIRGFTPLSESMEPEDVINILNEYLDLGTRAVFAYEGTLDKFIGDGIMSIFGAPIEHPDHALRAIKAALRMREGAADLTQRLQEKYGKSVRFGIGINSGPAVIGNIGSHDRLDYTAIGDTVNLAARLESNAKPGWILISKNTYERVKDQVQVTPLDPIKVKGKENLVEVFRVEGLYI